MSDTNDMRRDFEAWMLHTEKIIVGSSDPYPAGLERERWRVWQAATECAAAVERERCAMVCDSVNNYDNPMTANDCAAAIRQGGAA